ncbi:MAG TPA: sulfite exporter TauE/SafE family protein [Terriglobales bacterium]|jgi:uncharacterized membrane protein YfcA|nr:sulfite exporter TauE/SafE family protein [Terriglobales bacterium]
MITLLLVFLGLFAGLVGALSGTGGGLILAPMLALYFGLPIHQAIGTSLIAVITTSAASSSVNLQRHTADIRLGMTLELATALGAAVTAYLVGYINRTALEILFAVFLLYGAITILRKGGKTEDAHDEEESVLAPAPADDAPPFPPYEPKRYRLGMGASLVAGGLSGLLGIGGGPIKVPVMYLFMGVPLIVATATSNLMMGVTAAASAFVYYRRGDILPSVAAPLVVGVFVGSLTGARLAPRIHHKWVARLLVTIMLYLSLHMLAHIVGKFL